MKVDGGIPLSDPAEIARVATELEDVGYDGALSRGDEPRPVPPARRSRPSTPSGSSSAPAIAVAFARNPMTLANIGYDLQAYSEGRFRLGLGSQIKPHIEKRFSMPWSHPAARMRELDPRDAGDLGRAGTTARRSSSAASSTGTR